LRDGDNCLKPILDLLVSTGILEGDTVKHVVAWGGQYVGPPPDNPREVARVLVEVKACSR
jgi:hypothetical protein